MKKITGFFISLLIFLSCAITAHASAGVPEDVMNAAQSVVRIISEYGRGSSTGSGFVIKNEPGEVLVVTNDHVVEGNPRSISVWVDDDLLVDAEIVFTSPGHDLCVLQLPEVVDMQPLKLASQSPQQGEAIYAVGFPGVGDILSDTDAHTADDATITDGIISAIRSFTIEKTAAPVKLLQINAAINPGSSGGPLFNAGGEVIGVNTYKVNKDSQGVFGAVDISELLVLLDENDISLPASYSKNRYSNSENILQPVSVGIRLGIGAGLGALILLISFLLARANYFKSTSSDQTLRGYIARQACGLDANQAVALLLPIAVQLRDMHNNGKLHLQISPDTVLIKKNGAVLKEPSGAESDRYCSGFAAPEIYEGGAVGIAADVYSFAAVLLFAVTGKDPSNSLNAEKLQADFALCDKCDMEFIRLVKNGMEYKTGSRTTSIQNIIYQISPYNTGSFQAPTSGVPKKFILLSACLAVCAAVCAVVLVNPVLVPMINYNTANKLIKQGDYQAAVPVFQFLGDYRDSAEMLEFCELTIKEEKYIQAKKLMEEKSFGKALAIFNEIRGYLDSDELREECAEGAIVESARDNFGGKWIWNYPGMINPYDQYYNIDFDSMTIEFFFQSSSTEFTRTYEFAIDSATLLVATGFRDEGKVYIHYLGDEIFLEYADKSDAASKYEEYLYLHRI